MSQDKQKLPDRKPTKKWVRRANMWCVSRVENGKQIIEWHKDEPKL